MKKKFEHLEHTADIKMRISGKSLEEVFENSALAVSNYIGRGRKIKNAKKKMIEVEGDDNNELLYNFLDELLYLLDAKRFVVSKAKVKIKEDNLISEVWGDSVSKYKNLNHIKAATYAEMHIKKLKNKSWEAQIVMDV